MVQEKLDIFGGGRGKPGGSAAHRPLADQIRPERWEDFEGQQAIDRNLLAQLKSGSGKPPSMILWGPPGSGKTTLARLVGGSFSCRFVEVSAVLVGVKEIREIAATARRDSQLTILFVDEIHRLNKGQQDAFLPHVEQGTFVLIGATTENPSFYLTSALLSRARVIVLESLGQEALAGIARRGAAAIGLKTDEGSISLLAQFSGGDARKLLNMIEGYSQAHRSEEEAAPRMLTEERLRVYLKDAGSLFYDRSGEEHYNMASAFIKSLRGSDADAALYWCFRMIDSGEDPRFLLRRMMIFASEDIGNADPRALSLAVAATEAFERVGMPEGRIPMAQCIVYLATAPKSNRSYVALGKALEAVKRHPKVSVPIHLRNAPTELMKQLGYHEGYVYPHDTPEGYVPGVQYLPDELAGEVFYEPSEHGAEKVIKERLSFWRRGDGEK